MNEKTLELQRRPLFFRVYTSIQEGHTEEQILTELTSAEISRDYLLRLISDTKNYYRSQFIGPAIGWTIPTVLLTAIALFFLARGSIAFAAWIPAFAFGAKALLQWGKLSRLSSGKPLDPPPTTLTNNSDKSFPPDRF